MERHASVQRRVSGRPAGGETEIRPRGRLEKIEITFVKKPPPPRTVEAAERPIKWC